MRDHPVRLRPGEHAEILDCGFAGWREAICAVASGLASVEDVDRAVAYGPGLRWAIMGPTLTFHQGGGDGGLAHMLAQFRPSFEAWWRTMGTPDGTGT